jgi:hypothetical protein
MMTHPMSPTLRGLSGAVVLGAGATYAASTHRWVLGGDCGELATLFATGGIAHPPGYPTMVLWLRLFHWLPVSTPAYGSALATAILAMLAVLALQRACLAWGASAGTAAFVSAIYAFSPLTWELATAPEVFAMSSLFAGIILSIAGPKRAVGGAASAVLLGAVAGVALGDHQSIVLLAPIGLLGAWRGARESKRPAAAALAAVVAFVVGLVAPYVYEYVLAKTADPLTTPMWLEEASVRGIWFHFERVAYGTLSLTGSGAARHPIEHLLALGRALFVETRGLPLVFVAALALAPSRRKLAALARPEIVALVASFLLAGPLLIGSFDLALDGVAANIARRFYLLPELLVCLMAAIAIESLALPLANRDGWMAGVVALVAVLDGFAGWSTVQEHGRPSVALYLENALRTAPPNAILVGSGDQRWGGFMYARYALKERPDVFFLAPRLLPQAWYRRLAGAMTGVDFATPEGKAIGPKTTIARLLASGRPVLFTDWTDAKIVDTPHYSVGPLMHIVAPGETPPTDDALEAMNEAAFASFEIESTVPDDPRGWAYPLQVDYARAWIELAVRFEEGGKEPQAQECLARGATFAPWLVRSTPRE